MFFKICILSALSTLAASIDLPHFREDANAQTLTYEYKALDDGYAFEYTTSNGISRQETGHLKVVTNPDTREPDEIMVVDGFYSYTGDDGKFYQVVYHADENGYVPQVSTTDAQNPVLIGGQKPVTSVRKEAQNQYTFPYRMNQPSINLKYAKPQNQYTFPYKMNYMSSSRYGQLKH